jgi:LacI family transcriptional regulator
MATMNDVARAADVSIATVSHVINGTRFVSPERVERVHAAMSELEYTPDATARSLRVGRTETIGLIIPDNSNPFFAELAHRIEEAGFNEGYTTILANANERADRERRYVSTLISKRVDGLILAPSRTDDGKLTPILRNAGIPVVVIDRELPYADIVLYDSVGGSYAATQYLLELGHTRIGCITGPSDVVPAAQRVVGFRRALADAGMDPDAAPVVEADFHFAGGREATAQLLSSGAQHLTAVFATNDLMAAGALRELATRGLSVPGDISVIGFDDAPLAEMVSPPLTTIRQPMEDMANTAVTLLLDRVRGANGSEPARHVLPTSLVVRDSTAPPGGGG